MKKEGVINILGIRHHGPGSSKNLLRALEDLQPDVIALEMMDDGVDLKRLLENEQLHPPVAVLMHLKEDANRNVLLPFAEFSPEWQAMQYAKEKKIPVVNIDLPYAKLSTLPSQSYAEQTTEDILQQLAELSGFEQVEDWWDHFLERKTNEKEIFEQLQEIMELVREEVDISEVNLLREAYMREQLRTLIKKSKKTALICGAFHGPVLTEEQLPDREKEDKKLLKGIKKSNKVNATLIPYSYHRLTRSSGYSSGVDAPLYYEMLFSHESDIATRWLSHTAEMLRQKGFTVSVDEVMSAIHLSRQLCHLRNIELPGLAELQEAALSTLCHGSEERMALIHSDAFVGQKIGKVPDELIDAPFLKDFHQKVKSFRLSKYWQQDPSSDQKRIKELDLRKDLHLRCSRFLHQLDLLGMQWARRLKNLESGYGSFHENWRFHWDIEDEVQLYHNSTLGASVEQAALFKVEEKLENLTELPESIELLNKVLMAHLEKAIPPILKILNERAALTEDVPELLASNIKLLEISRYGSVRDWDQDITYEISERLHAKICHHFPYACAPMEKDAGMDFFRKLTTYYQLLRQTQFEGWMEDWVFALELMTAHEPLDGRIHGFALRMLHEQSHIDPQDIENELAQRLDSAFDPMEQATWLEGFLYGGGSVLLYNETLFSHLQHWVQSIDKETFTMVLPILNRSFASYPSADRQQILQKVRKGNAAQKATEAREHVLLKWVEIELSEGIGLLMGDQSE